MNKLLFVAFIILPHCVFGGNVIEVLKEDPRFSKLVEAVGKTELAEELQGEGPFTILAPTNDAFDSIDASNLEEILANATELKSILRRHIIVSKVEAIDVDSGPLNTSGGELIIAEAVPEDDTGIKVTFTYDPDTASGAVKEQGDEIGSKTVANVVQADIKASNGVIHAIDTILV